MPVHRESDTEFGPDELAAIQAEVDGLDLDTAVAVDALDRVIAAG